MASHRNPSGICENALWQLPIEPEKFTINNGAERIAYAADATVRTRTCTEEQGQEQLLVAWTTEHNGCGTLPAIVAVGINSSAKAAYTTHTFFLSPAAFRGTGLPRRPYTTLRIKI
jgi:hypothetical protein